MITIAPANSFKYMTWQQAFIIILIMLMLAPINSYSASPQQRIDLSSPKNIEAVFLKGLAFINANEPRKAVFLFRKILAQDPNLPRVRLELARAYFLIESWSESRAEFVTVLSGDIPSAVRKNILRFIRVIDARRGFDWNAAVGLSLSPEAGRDYKTDTVVLDFFGLELPFEVEREKDDVFGVKFDGSAEVRKGLVEFSEGLSVVGFLGASADLFEAQGTHHDDYLVSASAGSRFVWLQTTAEVAAHTSLRYRSGDVYEDRKGAHGRVEFRSEGGFAPFISASYSDVDVHQTEARDGDLYRVGLGFSKSVLGFANVGALANFERFDAKAAYESYDSPGLSVVGQADIGFGLSALAQARIERRKHKDTIPLFTEKRADTKISFDMEIIKNDIFLLDRFSPFLKVGYTYNHSSIDIFTYNEYRFLVGVKNAF